MQPGKGSFHDPAVNPKSTPMRLIPFGQMGNHGFLPQHPSKELLVIRSVAEDVDGSFSGSSALAFESGDAVHQGPEHPRVVYVGRGELGAQGNPTPVGDNMMLASAFGPIRRVRPGFFPPPRLHGCCWNRPLLWTNRFDEPVVASLKGCDGSSPKRRLGANRAGVANKSCHTRSPSDGATFPRESLSAKRIKSQKERRDCRAVSSRDACRAGVWAAGAMAQSIPKAHPQQVAWTFPTSLPENHSRPIDQTTIPIKLGTLNPILFVPQNHFS
jgi:hypothetical protein